MKTQLIWDLPVRLFHWMLAGAFVGAFAIGQLVDDDSPLFAVHMLLGGTMAFMVALRLVWGVVGSKHARLSAMLYGPGEVFAYLKGTLTGDDRRWPGHNPGSSVAIWAMFALTLATAVSGALMSQYNLFHELHEVFAYGLLAVVVAHIAGVIWHTLRHRENLTLSMITGKKDATPADAIQHTHPLVAAVFLGLTAAWMTTLVNNYDATTGELTIPGTAQKLQIGEGNEGEGEGGDDEESDNKVGEKKGDDDDDDDDDD